MGKGKWKDRLVIVMAAVLVASGCTTTAAANVKREDQSRLSPQVVLDWNSNAVTAVRASTPAKFQAEGLIYMSYVQAAVYDAVAKISGRYEPYHSFEASGEGASAEAAVISASYNTLVAYLGDPNNVLKGKYDSALAALTVTDAAKAAGVAVGKAASDDIVAFRNGDGRNAPVATPYGAGPLQAGVWVFAPPPSLQSAQTPWVAFMRPFMLRTASQFRSEPPPSLQSSEFVADFNETKAYGAVNSTVRTPDQTAVALFWNANIINQYNLAFRNLVSARGMDLVDAARALAMANLVGSDALIGCFDSKYFYTFWRPVTAIRNANLAGNQALVADPSWTPLITTPNHPEYPAAHGCITGAEAEVITAILGTRKINVDIPGGAKLDVTRHFYRAAELRQEIADARVWAGLHYRGSVDAGVDLGADVAQWTLKRYFQPVS